MKPFDYAAFGAAGSVLKANAVRLDRALASGLRPPPRLSVAEWAERYRFFPEGTAFEGRWRHEVAPELVEIMEALSTHDPCEEVVVIKCAQSGGSASAENLIGYISDVAPGPAMYVAPTIASAQDWATEKLWPMIEATPRLNPARGGTITAQGDGGSNSRRVRFKRGGYLLLSGANSAASLRQHTVRYAIEDDLDQFPDDLDKQGAPEAMVDARLKVYRSQGLSKRLKISTPRVAGASKIGAAWETSDQRRFYLKCPHCGSRFDPIWEPKADGRRDVQWPEGKPEEAYLVAPCCGGVVEHWQKDGMKLRDGWLSTLPVDGAAPPRHMAEDEFQLRRAAMTAATRRGFHITGTISKFTTWSEMAVGFTAALGDLNKLKGWVNLVLGDVFEVKGEAPDHERLKDLVEQEFGRGRRLPVGPVVTTIGADVQGDGIYYELLAWAENGESWAVDANFVPGATDVAGEGAWRDFDAICKRPVTYVGGRELPVDQICVDAGYHTAAVEAFCRGHANRLPVFGRDGWTRPVLGRGENLRYETQGRNAGRASKRAEDKAYLVGTYGVKLTFYGYLRRSLDWLTAALAGERLEVRGRCHFGLDLPGDYFEQLTSETIETKLDKFSGFPRRIWKVLAGRQNHYLDCRVYNHAAAEKLRLDTLTDNDWANLRAERCAELVRPQADLFDQAFRPAAQPAQADNANAVRGDSDWINTGGGWL